MDDALYRALFERLEIPVTLHELVCDATGTACDVRLIASNPAHDRLMGQPRNAHVGATSADLAGTVDRELLAASVEVLSTGVARRIAVPFPAGKCFDVTLFRVDERTFGITGREITADLRAQADRERLLLEREELVRTISHDLRAPLTSISSQAQLLARAPESERVATKAKGIVANARKMAEMIRDLVDSARADHVALQPVQLAVTPFLADLVVRLDGALDSARIALTVPAELPTVRADPSKLERVVVNLLANALRHGPPGTPVELIASTAPGALILEVTDHGDGIAPEHLPRVFDRFFRGPDAGGDGLGLGLHIARRFVEAHGGTIEAKSEPGRGATFRVTLPAGDR